MSKSGLTSLQSGLKIYRTSPSKFSGVSGLVLNHVGKVQVKPHVFWHLGEVFRPLHQVFYVTSKYYRTSQSLDTSLERQMVSKAVLQVFQYRHSVLHLHFPVSLASFDTIETKSKCAAMLCTCAVCCINFSFLPLLNLIRSKLCNRKSSLKFKSTLCASQTQKFSGLLCIFPTSDKIQPHLISLK